jgi:GT2 family glycosyltransferase
MNKSIAVLLTCHNRREKTIACLSTLYFATLPGYFEIDVFLVDDGSADGTEDAIKNNFPKVKLIKGNGNLYWNQGMRLAWETAAKKDEYDFYLWLNDDTLLTDFALTEMLECYLIALKKDNKPAIITGACKLSVNKNEFSYGGRTDKGPVIPNGKLQQCKYINGNVVLVSKVIFNNLGNLSSEYTHTMGDIDYGLRANFSGFNCYTTKSYVAICPTNPGIPAWCNPKVPLIKRWKLLHSPKGLNLQEYITFRKKFWGWRWMIYTLQAYLKALVPRFYYAILK